MPGTTRQGRGGAGTAGQVPAGGGLVDEWLLSQPFDGAAPGAGVVELVPGRQQVRVFLVEFVPEPAEGEPARK